MTKINQPENVLMQFSATHIALAEQIIRSEYSQYKPRAVTVAKHWVEYAPRITERGWIAGAESLVTYYSIHQPNRISDVEKILQPFKQKYLDSRNAKFQFSPHESIEVEQAAAKLKDQYCGSYESDRIEQDHADTDFHGATRGGLRSFITRFWRGKHNIG